MAGNLKIVLTDPISVVQQNVNKAIAIHLNNALPKLVKFTTQALKPMVFNWIMEQPEMQSLAAGGPNSLASNVGIPQGSEQEAATEIARIVSNSVSSNFTGFDVRLKGRFELNIQPMDFQDLLSSSAIFTIQTKKGVTLEWLRWLLEEGARPIIIGYEYAPQTGRGRSNSGTMKSGVSWRIKPTWAGTPENNFVTRSLINREKDIEKIIGKAIGGI